MSLNTVLIIDDESDIIFTITEICQFAGYEVISATNGLDGFELYKSKLPNLVVVDYHMPGWDGMKTVKKIKQYDESAAILVLTVDERQEISDRFMDAGATDFAIKPIKAPDLIARLKVNLRISEMQRAAKRTKENVFVDKGISSATLKLVRDFLKQNPNGITIEETSSGVSLAYQTVHRYIQHMMETGEVEVVPTYGQVGRPKNRYHIVGDEI